MAIVDIKIKQSEHCSIIITCPIIIFGGILMTALCGDNPIMTEQKNYKKIKKIVVVEDLGKPFYI